MCRAAALDEFDVLFGNLFGDPVAEITVGDEDNVGVFDFADDFDGGGGRDADVADGFDVGGGVDVGNDAVVGVGQFHLQDKSFVHLVGHWASGFRV